MKGSTCGVEPFIRFLIGLLALDRLQVLDQVVLFGVAQTKALAFVQKVDDIQQRRKPAIVEKATRALEQTARERSRAVLAVRRALGLEAAALVVHSELGRSVQIPTRFGEHRRHVAARTATPTIEDGLPTTCGCRI